MKKSQAAPEAPAKTPTFSDADVRTIDLFATLVQENMRTIGGLTAAQIMQMAKTLTEVNALRNKINDHVMEFISGKPG